MPRYVHEEIKQDPRKMKAKREEEVDCENSLRKKRVKKEKRSQSTIALSEAYDKLLMLNEAYEQELVACGIDTLAIKVDIVKRFAEQKHGREKKMSSEKKKGRKRREESDDTLKEFVQGLRAKSQRTTKKPKFLESSFQTEMPKKKRKGKKVVAVVKDDNEKGEKDEEKPLAILHEDFDIRLPGTVEEGFHHNFTVHDVPDVSDDENKWLQYFLTLIVGKKMTVYEVEDQTINKYGILQLLRGGRLKDETVEALVARLQKWLKLSENAD
ncbi:uncharacterized protein A4U43_C03F8790 [Asparagus officinalis]|uniref:Uncharacterized protein n=1 Tax=Asparagus officinalis TaxID=4686 RepID=A0A5P1FB76_ASPOF|nr:uncharacterized protein A4U43_C03F8790 [Asparagus officinalis]